MYKYSLFALSLLALSACGSDSRGGGTGDAAVQDDAALREAGSGMCTMDADCDDGIACTNDSCAVGGVCRNLPDNALCEESELCTRDEGCVDGCENDEDCNDGIFCNGVETCIVGECYTASPVDCDDGNDCTVDRCDAEIDGCVYETAPGCDAGMGMMMSMPDPFDPTMHYAGNFIVAPAPSLGCGAASYSFGNVTFSRSGASLIVQAGPLRLEQNPAPDGATFDVQVSRPGCANYRMQGTFTDSDTFSAMWTATMTGGSCTVCPNQSQMIFASRSDA